MTPTGTCEKCGEKYTGWALDYEEHCTCEKCGGRIQVEVKNVNKN